MPSLWKKAIVVPILKADKDPTSTVSYRPIFLTSTMGKTMERIINTRLNWLLETNNTIANEQAGFRINRSTSERIVKLSQFIKDALGNKHILTVVCFLLGDSPASDLYMPTFRNILSVPSSKAGVK